jgi:phosphomannomutase/phosphomannomutase/phosphoglucomutase
MGQDRLSCFKAYDIRGRVPDELDAGLVQRIGGAFAAFLGREPRVTQRPLRVAVGHDIRLSSPDLAEALGRGLMRAGVDVVDLGQAGTEEVYFATFHLGLDGGAMVTASHNPADYNGLKLVRRQSRPISSDTGLAEIERMTLCGDFAAPGRPTGHREALDVSEAYVRHLLGHVDLARLRSLRVVVNAGNGGAGAVLDRLEPHLPFGLIKLHHRPDGSFPNGVPNPLLPQNRQVTAEAVLRERADLGVAWDGDFDRCFFFDEQGRFIEGYYLVGLLAAAALSRHPGARIVHDPRLTWNTIELVTEAGGTPVQCKSGHAFMKQVMREQDAVYGGEMSAHHYFREFAYCDSGMIPWLLVAQQVSTRGMALGQLVGPRMERFPASGEINRRVGDAAGALARARERFGAGAVARDETDGLSLEFPAWRFNLRASNTEPLIRLNVESRGDRELMERKTREVLDWLDGDRA